MVLGNPATQAQADDRPQAGTEHQHRQGSGSAVRRVQVRDHRHRRRRTASLADRHADPRQHQGQEVAGHAAQHGHQAPGDAAGEAITGLRPMRSESAPQREAEHGVEHREGHPREQTDASIGDAEFELHRLNQNRHQLAVDVVEHVDAGEHEQRIVRSPCHGGLDWFTAGAPGFVLVVAMLGLLWFFSSSVQTISTVVHKSSVETWLAGEER